MKHGNTTEPIARQMMQTKYDLPVRTCGTFQDREHCFIAATPDVVIADDALGEIKCPMHADDYASAEAAVEGGYAVS